MEIEQLFFKSDLFEVELGEDEETNPRLYGKQLAGWLRSKFIEKGYQVEEIIPEDWGWCVMCAREPYLLWIGCSSTVEYKNTKQDEPIPHKEDITWCCFATAEIPLLKRLFKRPATAAGLAKLKTELAEIIRNETRITIIENDI